MENNELLLNSESMDLNMSKTKSDESERNKRKSIRKKIILAILFFLVVVSIINMYSTCIYNGNSYFSNPIRNHISFLSVSVLAFIICANINYMTYNNSKFNGLLLLGTVGAFSLMLFGSKFLPKYIPVINGTTGWIRFGSFGLQPSEFLKLPFIIIIAHLLSKCEEKKRENFSIIFYVIPIFTIFAIFIHFQNDLGTLVHYLVILCFMLFFTRIDMKIIVFSICSVFAIFFGLLYYIYSKGEQNLDSYKLKRISVFMNGLLKNEYGDGIGYQIGQSILAFGNGGFLGKGYANGTQKYSYLPEIRTDFILATVGEEFGFVGIFVILILFLLLFNLAKNTAMDTNNYFGKYLAIGISGFVITQMIINLYVVIGILPVLGVPMPILSYGGTSIFTIFLSLGILTNMNFNN
ncbi:MAG: FtsW/RodA/SpoVE family cell cycle protein [Fusobacteriaceae bacterium]|jgi:cell division protein FtsW|nr:FtsW/RodA/SpoVE family cell cycle protein [Fusobacteriaceae bacterium]